MGAPSYVDYWMVIIILAHSSNTSFWYPFLEPNQITNTGVQLRKVTELGTSVFIENSITLGIQYHQDPNLVIETGNHAGA